ncbi:MAG: hypothetical protein HOI07_04115 [Betaproteobacteria bacterium]|jgi:hypothetical protein|nr:hypothetical protein [Betaproteobacteria bacterium]
MIVGADFDAAYYAPACKPRKPKCAAPNCFIASYPPISKPGVEGSFNVNTQFLQPNRYYETVGPVPVRSEDFKC